MPKRTRTETARIPIQVTRNVSDEEALSWLALHGPIKCANADLAALWGWSRTKLSRRLKMWEQAGAIVRAPEGLRCPPAQEEPTPPPASNDNVDSQNQSVCVELRILAAALGLVALMLGAVGIVLNARFAASFGRSAEASWILAVLGVAIDIAALTMPWASIELWTKRRRITAVAAWGVWLVCIVITLLASSGYASTHIGDAIVERSMHGERLLAASQDLRRLRAEREQLMERRAVAAIEAELARAQPAAASVWRATAGCTDITRTESARLCEPILRLRQARGAALRRDAIDREIHELNTFVATAPAVAASDPGARMISELTAWLSLGVVNATERDVQRVRILGLMVMPACAGFLLSIAMLLALPKPRPEGR